MNQKPGDNLLQSHGWALFQQALGRSVVERDGYLGIQVRESGVSYLYLPYGPQSDQLPSLSGQWQGGDYDFVRVEPRGEVTSDQLKQLGFVPSIELNPSHTSIINLEQDEASLRSNLSSGHRNAINGAKRRGISLETSTNPDDTAEFLRLIHLTAGRRGFRPHDDNYYLTMVKTLMPLGKAKLFLGRYEGRVIAAAIGLDEGQTRYYAHAGADPATRKLQAAVPLVWHMIMDAKTAGMTRFDLWGVAPVEANSSHPWTGFTQFKRAFGGQDVSYAGTWDLPVRVAKYRAYRLARQLNRWVKR